MATCNLTTKLNAKIIGIVLLLLITVTTYNHWLSSQEQNEKNVYLMKAITDYLVQKKPVGIFSDKTPTQSTVNLSIHDQVLNLNKELQPLLNDIFMPVNDIKFGFYSCRHESIVAIGPNFDISMLIPLPLAIITTLPQIPTEQLLEKKHSLLWHGANSLTYFQAIKENDIIVGYAFASYNMSAVSEILWKRTVNTFLGAFIMLLICIIIFRELFVNLKKDLQLFAESIVTGRSSHYNCEITEFNPILKYISEQTEKMTRLDRLNIIGEMAAGIAHEIRNPMTTVRGLLQFLGNKGEFSTQKENFTLMINELDRANNIITEFLALAKNSVMEFSENNLNSILHEIFPLLQADALCHNCQLRLTLSTLPTLSVDPNSIRQLIFNLVRNGLDAMPGGGVINISTKVTDSSILLSIQDSGIGIPLEILAKLGTPFFTTKEKGTGLGLAICYRIIQRHGATIEVESKLGKGTTFTITFNHSPSLTSTLTMPPVTTEVMCND